MSFASLVVSLLLAAAPAPAAPASAPTGLVISFPKSAGDAEFVGAELADAGKKCRLKESTGSAESDAFACNSGPQQRRKFDGKVYAMTWRAPAYKGVFVPSSMPPVDPKPKPKIPGSVRVGPSEFAYSLITRLTIDKDGRVVGCAIESSSGHAEQDLQMCRMEQGTRYLPATLDGVPVEEVRYELVIVRRSRFVTTTPL